MLPIGLRDPVRIKIRNLDTRPLLAFGRTIPPSTQLYLSVPLEDPQHPTWEYLIDLVDSDLVALEFPTNLLADRIVEAALRARKSAEGRHRVWTVFSRIVQTTAATYGPDNVGIAEAASGAVKITATTDKGITAGSLTVTVYRTPILGARTAAWSMTMTSANTVGGIYRTLTGITSNIVVGDLIDVEVTTDVSLTYSGGEFLQISVQVDLGPVSGVNGVGAVVASPGFTTPYVMSYVAAGQVSVAPRLGTNCYLLFNDGLIRAHGGTLTFDFANGTGNNGLDNGAEAPSTWYYLYAVAAGSDFFLKASTVAPPTGPSGFSVWKYLGAFRNDGSSNILRFLHEGKKVTWSIYITVTSASGAAATQVGNPTTSVSCAGQVPATASSIEVDLRVDVSGVANLGGILRVGGVSAEPNMYVFTVIGNATTEASTGMIAGSVPIFTPQTIYYDTQRFIAGVATAGTLGYFEIRALGYIDGYVDN